MDRHAAALIVTLGLILAAAIVGAVFLWLSIDGAGMTLHGYLALALGVLASLGLGVGLMALTFYSARAGYDDQVENEDRDPGFRS